MGKTRKQNFTEEQLRQFERYSTSVDARMTLQAYRPNSGEEADISPEERREWIDYIRQNLDKLGNHELISLGRWVLAVTLDTSAVSPPGYIRWIFQDQEPEAHDGRGR